MAQKAHGACPRGAARLRTGLAWLAKLNRKFRDLQIPNSRAGWPDWLCWLGWLGWLGWQTWLAGLARVLNH